MLVHLLFRGVFGLDCLAENLYNEIFKFRDYEFPEDMGRAGWLIEPLIPRGLLYREESRRNDFLRGIVRGKRYDLFWSLSHEPYDYSTVIEFIAEEGYEDDLSDFLARARKANAEITNYYQQCAHRGGSRKIIATLKAYETESTYEYSCLPSAAGGGHLDLVKELMDNPLNTPETYETAVRYATYRNHQHILDFLAECGHYHAEQRLIGACWQNSLPLVQRYYQECLEHDPSHINLQTAINYVFECTEVRSPECACDILEFFEKVSKNPDKDFSYMFDCIVIMGFDIFRHPRLREICFRHLPPEEILEFLIPTGHLAMLKKYFADFESQLSIEERENLMESAIERELPEIAEIIQTSLQKERCTREEQHKQ